MCGIAGVLENCTSRLEGSGKRVHDMLDLLKPRGPDDSRVISLGAATLGACRLSIVDKEHGRQPISSACTGLQIVFNGEIYNFRELRNRLDSKHILRGNSDTEVLLHLCEEFGVDAFEELNGMFAFCITDGETGYLVRDRLGIKPLYYTFKGEALLFASEAKALFPRRPIINLEPTFDNFEANVGYETPVAGIYEVPPGSYLTFNMKTGHTSLSAYYTIDNRHVKSLNEEAAVDRLRWLVEDAISLRVPSDMLFGCYVSGGLDSAIVAQVSKPELLLSAIVKDREYMHEEKYLRVVAEAVGGECITISPSPEEFVSSFVEMVYALDFPTTTLAAFVQFLLSREASKKGLKVVLSGIGADEYLGGYVRHIAMLRPEKLLALKTYESYGALVKKLPNHGANLTPSERHSYLINRSPYRSNAYLDIIRTVFGRQASNLNGAAASELRFSLPSLLRTDDRLNMHFGVEGRAPFLDFRLIDFVFSLQDDLKLRELPNGTILTKYVLRKAFESHLPDAIVNRLDKVGFPSPVALWLEGTFSKHVQRAYEVINGVPELAALFPKELLLNKNEFSRKRWQITQWAAWYLLFCEHWSITDTTQFLFDEHPMKGAVA